ncbi:LCP family protein [bacterium]|nr:LCP family protein [bacterium]
MTFLILPLMISACGSLNPLAAAHQPTSTPKTILLAYNPAQGTGETPFLPVDPTATPSGSIFPTATPSSQNGGQNDPEVNNSNQASSSGGPVNLIEQPENQVNILLLGSDQRPYEGGFRTDVILLVTVNMDLQTINLTSFPRDLYVTLPGYYNDRINSAQYRGGFTLMADTFEYNFGVRPDYYALINFYGFQDLINTLGGIDVQVAQTLTDHRDGYGDYTVYPGTVHMNGDTALWYVRSRYSTSDFDRTRRQQEVLTAIMRKIVSLDAVTKIPDLYNQFQGTVETNLPLAEVIPMLSLTDDFMSGTIGRYAVGPGQVSNWVTPAGAQVLVPNKPAIQAILKEALNTQ